ncbi:MAG: tRNA guanosine(34) transglycosylase Tgt [Planctomycetota bacterium]|nr:MAG: tRNA guanosine(34) transglycosylase Tgt [Planctomycetota bacterium]
MSSTSAPFRFTVERTDRDTAARLSTFETPHGAVEMPAFMPVGTLGTVKGLPPAAIRETGAQMVLANAYHLARRPGEEIVRQLGGLHRFMNWDGPILTDSGGFQIFSLAAMTTIDDRGATFRSHIDGSEHHVTPERAIAIQEALGPDVAMVLDHVVALPNERAVIEEAMQRSVRWAARSIEARSRADQAVFAIVQGGLDPQLRRHCAAELRAMPFDGFAIGGLSVGEEMDDMLATLDVTVPQLPDDRPRYLMGVGRPEDLLEAIARGVDLFDCVLPTRNGRNAFAFTDAGSIRLRNEQFKLDERPLDEACPCPACRHSRGYLRHLFAADEMLGPILVSIHNLTYYQRLLAEAREAIGQGQLGELLAAKRAGWSAAAR